jgi:UDP-N-acetylmuramoyl-tripeptide--D-alanyl-D-alanine ligase
MNLTDFFSTFTGPISTDTRTLVPGAAFVALKGERFDGHDHVQQAKDKGAVIAVVDHAVDVDIPQCIVVNTLAAYGEIARLHRNRMPAKVITLTGSAGKTTAKNMLAAIFSAVGPTLATQKNFNNEIGVPMTLLQLKPEHQWAVIENGANSHGEIDRNSRVAEPDCGMVLLVAEVHVEGMGTADKIAVEKGAIYPHIRPQGLAVLPRDDQFFDQFVARASHDGIKQMTFGFSPLADVTARDIKITEGGQTSATVVTPQGNFELTLQLLGRHNVYNALAATAVAVSYDIPLATIAQALAGVEPADKRLQVYVGHNKAKLIDDCYNGSPVGVLAALEILAACPGEKVWVFGDMAELGERTAHYHQLVGEKACELGIDQVYAVGEQSLLTLQSFGKGGLHFNSKEDLIEALKPKLHEHMTVLIKGSRSKKLETITEALRK